ncbi:MAG: glycosyltransferase family 2 protein, partial [Methanobacterium sp.]
GVLLKVLKDLEFNKPLYYLTVPGMVLGIGGLIMGAFFVQDFTMGKGLTFGPTILMILLIVVGSFMALTGILLHSISALMRETRAA